MKTAFRFGVAGDDADSIRGGFPQDVIPEEAGAQE